MGSFPESYNDPGIIIRFWEPHCSEKCSKSWMSKQATDAGADPGVFLGGSAPLRNGITDWCRKYILKANTKKKGLLQAFD